LARSGPAGRISVSALALCGSTRYTTAGTFPFIVRRIPAARAIMAKIHFIDHSGEKRTIEIENGATVMEGAIRNAIPGIEAECGGACACATCHVYVDEAWREKVGAPSPMEEDMLDFGFDVRPNSRLSCQIKVTDDLDGLVVSTPERQA
jgi:2Fe-2S ferredoxin